MKTLDSYELTLSLICYMLRGYLLCFGPKISQAEFRRGV